MQPKADWVRRAQRIIRMVSELHRMGYQRLRIMPYEYPLAWRGVIAPVERFSQTNGALIIGAFDENVAGYTSASENQYFGWQDAQSDNARGLAAKFVQRFPRIAKAGRGSDWRYAGWLLELLGQLEDQPGVLPIVQAEFGPDALSLSALPLRDYVSSAADRAFPLPPPGEAPTRKPKPDAATIFAKLQGAGGDQDITRFPAMAGRVSLCIAGGIQLAANPRDEDAHMPLIMQALRSLDNGAALISSGLWPGEAAVRQAFLERMYVGEENVVVDSTFADSVQFGLEHIAYRARELVQGFLADPGADWDLHGHHSFNSLHAFATCVLMNSAGELYGSRTLQDFVWRQV